jgi:acetyl esterase/lipase
VVVLIPGGTWLGGRREGTRPLQFALAARGFVAVCIDYRQNPDQPFPHQLNDAKCAVRWLRANAARLGIDKERVAAVGYSAGGNVACMLGLTGPADRVQAVASLGGVSDLTRLYEDHCLAKPWTPWKGYLRYCIEAYMGGPPARRKDAYKKASAISYARKGGAPTLLIHGTADTLVPPSQSRMLAAALKRAGADVTLEAIKEGGHFLGGAHERAAHEVLFKFLDRHLRPAPGK